MAMLKLAESSFSYLMVANSSLFCAAGAPFVCHVNDVIWIVMNSVSCSFAAFELISSLAYVGDP